MSILIDYKIPHRKNFKRNRVKTHQRFKICPSPIQSRSPDPDSLLMDKILKKIEQEMKGENNE